MIIEYAGYIFNRLESDDAGCYWYVTAMEGWAGTNVRVVTVDPTSQDGTIVANALRAPKALIVTIIMKAPNEDAFWVAYNAFLNAHDHIYDTKPFIVTEGETRRKVDVLRSMEPRVTLLGSCAFEAEISLMAPNPAKVVV